MLGFGEFERERQRPHSVASHRIAVRAVVVHRLHDLRAAAADQSVEIRKL